MIDVNVFLSRWPFRRLPHDETSALVKKLKSAGVEQAWVASFDALLHKDVDSVNRRLAEECRQQGELLVPFGCVNPSLPDWQEDVRRCKEVYRMAGVRLHPNYHRYSLESDGFAQLLALCEQHGLIVQIALRMEDDRTQHPLVQVPDVDPMPLVKLLPRHPQLTVVLLNSQRTLRGDQATQLATAGRCYFEIAMLEGIGGVGKLTEQIPFERILFGSYFPFFYFESSLLKLKESELGETIRSAIATETAKTLISRATINTQ